FTFRPPGPSTSKANTRPGSQSVMRHTVQYTGPFWFRRTCPRNFTPTAGPVAPSGHSASNVSGLNLPVLVMSLTSSHTACGVADMWTVTESCTPRPYARAPLGAGARLPTKTDRARTGKEHHHGRALRLLPGP